MKYIWKMYIIAKTKQCLHANFLLHKIEAVIARFVNRQYAGAVGSLLHQIYLEKAIGSLMHKIYPTNQHYCNRTLNMCVQTIFAKA